MKKTIKITIATGIFPPSIGGPAQYSKLLLDKLPASGFEISVVSFDGVRKFPKIIRHALYFFILIKKSFNADVIYAQDPVSVGFPSLVVSKLLRKKFVLKIVGDYAWEQGRNRFGVTETLDQFVVHKQKSRFVRFLQSIEKKVASGADCIITPSEYLKKIVMSWGVRGDKIKVIYNAFIHPQDIERVEKKNRKKIVTIGRLVPWKGFAELIDVITALRNEHPEIQMDIIGTGPLECELKEVVSRAGAGEYIHMRGQLAHEDLYLEIASSDLFVLNTSYEGFSHLILENMALGTPIVTTKVGGNIEIIKHLSNGYLIERNNEDLYKGIDYMLRNTQKRKEMAEQALVDVGRCTEENMLRELVRTLREL